ncbi:hypothetical protein BJY04DRAFT_192623 [Aspergillus karnatakaensis]|uniref:uncharacterized protein n=1 Tax=Aspergillus karnatakaensis TaxID=1810916 RepID=UPI003CCD60C9
MLLSHSILPISLLVAAGAANPLQILIHSDQLNVKHSLRLHAQEKAEQSPRLGSRIPICAGFGAICRVTLSTEDQSLCYCPDDWGCYGHISLGDGDSQLHYCAEMPGQFAE